MSPYQNQRGLWVFSCPMCPYIVHHRKRKDADRDMKAHACARAILGAQVGA